MKGTEFFDFFRQIGFSGFFDIAFMSLLIYSVLVWFKRTKAGFVLTGIIIISIIYLLARQFDLVLIYSVLQAFFAVIIIALIVIFQDELRRLFEQIAVWGLNPKFKVENNNDSTSKDAQILSNTLIDFAKKKIGALIVLTGKDKLDRYLEGGVDLNGEISEPLLKSLFDPHSIGHDGAVIIEMGKITKFSAHLPLSKNFEHLSFRGTRHAAALGLAELTDALCLIVSEELGTISIAKEGKLEYISFEQLNLQIENFYEDIGYSDKSKLLRDFFKKNYREKVIAVALTLALWFVLVFGSGLIYKTFTIPVAYAPLNSNYEIAEITPPNVKVTFLGKRKSFFFIDKKEISLFLKIPNTSAGTKTVSISDTNLNFPEDLRLENIDPKRVKVKVKKTSTEKK